ncbi:hypothetical protein [Acinetobacter seifertii]|uniref:hypothetical protein n=1 Tax=Acinetobacter seifertii TaxID=1530123 RepID=UPI000C227130|nr:hypothetical protein [Acinetobacter seifertii]PJG65684.1 hypothetical protein CVD09_15050 [Acinetobacter seifertii]
MSNNEHSIAPGNDRKPKSEDLFLQYQNSKLVQDDNFLKQRYADYEQLFNNAVQYTPISENNFLLLQKRKRIYGLFLIGCITLNAIISFYIIYKLILQDYSTSLEIKILLTGIFSWALEVFIVSFVFGELIKDKLRTLYLKYSIRNEDLKEVVNYSFKPVIPQDFDKIKDYSKLDSQLKAMILQVTEYRNGKLLDVDFEELNIRSILNCRAEINHVLKNHLDYEKQTQDVLESIKSDKA